MRRTWRPPEVVLATALVLSLAAAGATVASGPRRADGDGSSAFQRATGGLGLGRAVDLSRCACAFDARLAPACKLRHHPIPGADPLCADHSVAPPEPTR